MRFSFEIIRVKTGKKLADPHQNKEAKERYTETIAPEHSFNHQEKGKTLRYRFFSIFTKALSL